MPVMKLEIMLLLPLITGPNIQYRFSRQSGHPCLAVERLGRAGFDATPATAAEVFLHRAICGKIEIGENSAQSHPGAKRPGDQLAMAANPSQPRPGGSGFLGKVALDVDRIRARRRSQSQGAKPSAFDFGGKGGGLAIDLSVYPGIFVGIGLVGTGLDTGHDLRGHGHGPGQGQRKAMAGLICWRGKRAQIRHSP